MVEIPKPSEDDKEFFRSVIPEEAEVKPMFGNLGAFVNGICSPAWRSDADLAAQWVEKAHAYVSTLPPKVKKPRKSPAR